MSELGALAAMGVFLVGYSKRRGTNDHIIAEFDFCVLAGDAHAAH